MLARAREADSETTWIEADLAAWAPDAPVDVVFSNAALHWLDDHERLFPRLTRMLAPGGQLVIGNMRDTSLSNLWPMEFICDWSVYYRNESAMWAMVEGLPADSSKLETDPTGRVYMLSLRKP